MTIHHIAENNSVLNTFLSEIRDQTIQKDSLRFRRNIERIGEILSYELSKTLFYKNQNLHLLLHQLQLEYVFLLEFRVF